MSTFRTIEPAPPIDGTTLLENLHEIAEALDYAARCAQQRVPVSPDYLSSSAALAHIVCDHAERLLGRRVVLGAAWFAIGAVAATAAHLVLLGVAS